MAYQTLEIVGECLVGSRWYYPRDHIVADADASTLTGSDTVSATRPYPVMAFTLPAPPDELTVAEIRAATLALQDPA